MKCIKCIELLIMFLLTLLAASFEDPYIMNLWGINI